MMSNWNPTLILATPCTLLTGSSISAPATPPTHGTRKASEPRTAGGSAAQHAILAEVLAMLLQRM